MKKIVVSLIISFVCLVCNAQQHLEIMGIPIDGNIETFKQKLVQKGFKLVDPTIYSDIVSYEEIWARTGGTYAGEPIDAIIIYSSPHSKTVFGVVLNILFDTKLDGERFFNRVKNVAEKKYNTSSTYGNVAHGYGPRMGVTLEFSKGTITVSDPAGPLSSRYYTDKWCVTIAYFDEFNHNISLDEQIFLKEQRDSDI